MGACWQLQDCSFLVFFGSFFNGVDYGSACLLGMGMYLCIVVVTCTGIIVSKVTCRKNEDNSEEKDK